MGVFPGSRFLAFSPAFGLSRILRETLALTYPTLNSSTALG